MPVLTVGLESNLITNSMERGRILPHSVFHGISDIFYMDVKKKKPMMTKIPEALKNGIDAT